MNLRWSWDEPHPRPVPLGRQGRVGGHVARPGPAPRPGAPPPPGPAGRRPGLPPLPARRPRTGSTATSPRPRWFQTRAETQRASPLRLVAYFSPEFGISEALPQYSGGLGVLAGDHLKASSDLGVPLVGVGLFYRIGLLQPAAHRRRHAAGAVLRARPRRAGPDPLRRHPHLGRPGRRAAARRRSGGPTSAASSCTCSTATSTGTPPRAGPSPTASTAATPSTASARRSSSASAGCGRCRPSASTPQVFHTNEGHAGFLGLERVRQLVAAGLSFGEAVEAVRAGLRVHDPHAGPGRHRPLPRGADGALLRLASRPSAASTFDELMALGRRDDEPDETRFNMAVMGLRLAAAAQRRRRAPRRR